MFNYTYVCMLLDVKMKRPLRNCNTKCRTSTSAQFMRIISYFFRFIDIFFTIIDLSFFKARKLSDERRFQIF